jgi:hypothetical protein
MNEEINTLSFKYDEIESHFMHFIKEDGKYLFKNELYFTDELHHNAFNQDYYIIGTYQAKKWCEDEVFNIIEIIKDYESFNFGEVNTDFSSPERVVNMYTYIIGEYIVNNWLEKFEFVKTVFNNEES